MLPDTLPPGYTIYAPPYTLPPDTLSHVHCTPLTVPNPLATPYPHGKGLVPGIL